MVEIEEMIMDTILLIHPIIQMTLMVILVHILMHFQMKKTLNTTQKMPTTREGDIM